MKVNQVIKLKITNIEKYIYNLVDEKGKNYFFNMEFIDVENKTPYELLEKAGYELVE